MKKQIEYKEDGFGNKKKIGETEFDSDGNIIWQISFHDSGDIFQENEYTYKGNKLINEKCWSEHGNCVNTEFQYDTEGNLIKKVVKYDDGSQEVEKRILLDSKEIVENYDEEGNLVEKQIIEYVENKEVISNKFYNGDDLIEASEYEYDEKGALRKRIVTDFVEDTLLIYIFENSKEGEFDIAYERIENENGNLLHSEKEFYKDDVLLIIEKENYWNDEEQIRIFYEYENEFLVKETSKNFQNKIIAESQYYYNEFGDIERIIAYDTNSNYIPGSGGKTGLKSILFYENQYN